MLSGLMKQVFAWVRKEGGIEFGVRAMKPMINQLFVRDGKATPNSCSGALLPMIQSVLVISLLLKLL